MKYKSKLALLPVPVKLMLSYPDSYPDVGNQRNSVLQQGSLIFLYGIEETEPYRQLFGIPRRTK